MSHTRIGLLALGGIAMAGFGAWVAMGISGRASAQPRVQQRDQPARPAGRLQQSKPSATELNQVQRAQQELARLRQQTPPKGSSPNEKAALAGVTLAALQAPAVLSPQKPYLNANTYLRVSPQNSAVSFDASENAIGVASAPGATPGQVSVSFRSAPGMKYVVECLIDTSKAKNKTGPLNAVIYPYGPKVTADSTSQRVAMVVQNTSANPRAESVYFWAASDFWILTRCEVTPAKV